jgi:plastocyanin
MRKFRETHMPKYLIAALSLAVAAAAPAQPAVVAVELSNFSFSPASVQLRAGVPATLQLHNASGGGHNFSAPGFFAAARLDPRSAALVRNGRVEVPADGTVKLALVPAAGRYKLRCTHTLHSAFGMKGFILVR